MPEETLEDLGEDLEEGGPPKGIDPEVLKTAEKAGAAKLYAQIVSDPDVGKLLQLKAANKKVKVMAEGEGDTKEPMEEKEPDFENLSEKEKMQWLVRQVSRGLDSTIDQKLVPILERVDGLNSFATSLKQKDAVQQVDDLKKEFKDFAVHAPRMQELAGENPNLSVRQLYVLAAQEAGVLTRSERRTTSEKPSNTSARPAKKQSDAGVKIGFGGLREIISKAAADVIKSQKQIHSEDDD